LMVKGAIRRKGRGKAVSGQGASKEHQVPGPIKMGIG